jgi:hypothetical protein
VDCARFGQKTKLMRLACIVLCCLIASFSSAQKSPVRTPAQVSIEEALRLDMLQVELQGLGGHQGKTIKIICKNRKGRSFTLLIPAGQLMEPSDPAAQTLVVAEELIVNISPKTPVTVELSTFCTQAGEMSPPQGGGFSVGAMAPQRICNLLRFLKENNKLASSEAQAAVWCMTNDRSLGYIHDTSIAKFVADELGKNLPGYKVKYQRTEQVPGRLADLGEALEVEANFRYFLEKDEKTLLVLVDSTGKEIKQLSSKPEFMKAGEHRSGLNVKVWNLPKGKYLIRLKTLKDKVLHDMEVEF